MDIKVMAVLNGFSTANGEWPEARPNPTQDIHSPVTVSYSYYPQLKLSTDTVGELIVRPNSTEQEHSPTDMHKMITINTLLRVIKKYLPGSIIVWYTFVTPSPRLNSAIASSAG